MSTNPFYRRLAKEHFKQARRQAVRDRLSAWLTGQDEHLLPFESIRAELKKAHPQYEGVKQIPLEKIVGSVGRYKDFTRRFLPLTDSLRDRWIRVESWAIDHGWPPIELYRIGDIYFVRDGNHRVAVARQMGNDTIEAQVWGFSEEIDLESEDSLDEVLIRLGEHNFMEQTGLDQSVPDHNIRFTIPGQYTELLAQISDLRAKLALIDGEEMDFKEAALAWYELSYLTTCQIIQESSLLNKFPDRTEADFFAWLSVHRQELSELYGEGSLADWVEILARTHKDSAFRRLVRSIRQVLGWKDPTPMKGI